MRIIHAVTGLILAVTMLPAAHAVQPNPMAVRLAYECAEHYHDMITAFHLTAFTPDDAAVRSNFDVSIKRADQCAGDLVNMATDAGLPVVVSTVSNGRKRVIELAQSNATELAARGVAHLQTVTTLIQAERDFVPVLLTAASELGAAYKASMSQDALAARKLAVDIKYINARYTERSTEVILRADTGEKNHRPTDFGL